MSNNRIKVCFVSASSGDWGGASRVLFTNLKLIDLDKIEPIVLLPSEGEVVNDLERRGIRYEIWGKQHEPNGLINYFKAIRKAYIFFKSNNIDILHYNHANYWRAAETVAAKLLKIPILTHYHVTVTNPSPFVRKSSAIIAVSDYVAEHSLPRDCKKYVVHNSVDINRFTNAKNVKKEFGLHEKDIVISYIGQIRRIKGVDTFIEMANSINNPQVKFLIVGECRDKKKISDTFTLEEMEEICTKNPNIIYTGYRADVENLYKTSDIICVPSRWEEPFGLINIEAGASGVPVVATRVGGIPEVIEDGVSGYIVDKDDVAGYTEKVVTLINDAELRMKMGADARKLVLKRFYTSPLRKLEKVYEELVRK